MSWIYVFDFLTEIAFLLLVFTLALCFAIFVGRQAIMNLIFGLYLALLISIEFPYYDTIFKGLTSDHTQAGAKLGFFLFITTLTTTLCYRVMPSEFREKRFESIPKKAILALAATILVMIFSFNVLPVTEFLTPSTPIQSLFAPEAYYFWWLLAPLVVLYFV
ncbi:hypothetical protein H6784_01000 [Candidatus Nomurabacteria bacterium]|nr:hypothetical protein [Candidatus Kaiserbacteria bacterium]MCB9813970.1 hypothetical protein [Candidatus Nomurabacteria bacterium]